MSRIQSRGRPCASTSLTGTIVTPKPWVKTIRWLTHEPPCWFFSGASSRADSMTWRVSPSTW